MNWTQPFPEHDSKKLRRENAPLAFRHFCAPARGGVPEATNKREMLQTGVTRRLQSVPLNAHDAERCKHTRR